MKKAGHGGRTHFLSVERPRVTAPPDDYTEAAVGPLGPLCTWRNLARSGEDYRYRTSSKSRLRDLLLFGSTERQNFQSAVLLAHALFPLE